MPTVDRGRDWKALQAPFEPIMAESPEDKHCYSLSRRVVAALLSQTGYLHWSSRWSKDGGLTDDDKREIELLASQVESELMQDDQCDDCFDYGLSSSIVDIAPMNPYTDPGAIPDGYAVPPWTILTAGVFGTALAAGDMLAAPPISGILNPPRIRISVTGDVLVEVNYVPIPSGGMLQIQADGDLGTLRYVDMNADIISVPPEGEPDLAVEHKFEGTGDHFLDIAILPRIDDTLEFLGIGGALRKITICGRIQECIDMPFDVRQNEENPCKLDKSTDDGATWDAWANLRLCPPVLIQLGGGVIGIVMPDDTVIPTATGDPTYDGREHAPPPAPRGGSETDNKCIAAANAVNVLVSLHATVMRQIDVPDELSIAAAIAGLLISLLFLPIAIGLIIIAIGGLLTIAGALTYGDFDSDTQDQLRCILDCAATDTAGVVTFDFASVQSQVNALSGGLDIWAAISKYLDIIGESGLNLAGATTAITSADCSDCPCSDPCESPLSIEKAAGSWGTLPTGIITSGHDEYSGYIYAHNDSPGPLTIGFDHAVLVKSFRIDNGGSYTQEITLVVGTATQTEDYNANSGHHNIIVDPPQLVDHVSVETVAGIGLAFGYTLIYYCEPT